MSTIKFVPMEFFAQFALTQMRRLQARGAVGAAFSGAGRGWWAQVAVCRHGAAFMGMGRRLRAWGAVGAAFRERGGVVDRGVAVCGRGALSARLFWCVVAVGGRRSLFVRLSRRRVPIVNAGRCRRGFPGAGRGCRSWGRRLRAWGAVGAAFQAREHRWQTWDAACGRGALSARLFLVRGRRWWAQVAACGHEALSAGAGCCRRGFFEHGNIIGGCGELLVGAGRCLRHEALLADAGRRLRSFFRRAGAPPRLAHAPALPRGARCLPLGLPFGCTSPSPRRGACFPARPLAARPPPFRRAACRFAA